MGKTEKIEEIPQIWKVTTFTEMNLLELPRNGQRKGFKTEKSLHISHAGFEWGKEEKSFI